MAAKFGELTIEFDEFDGPVVCFKATSSRRVIRKPIGDLLLEALQEQEKIEEAAEPHVLTDALPRITYLSHVSSAHDSICEQLAWYDAMI